MTHEFRVNTSEKRAWIESTFFRHSPNRRHSESPGTAAQEDKKRAPRERGFVRANALRSRLRAAGRYFAVAVVSGGAANGRFVNDDPPMFVRCMNASSRDTRTGRTSSG